MPETITGLPQQQEPTEKKLSPEEFVHAVINTLGTTIAAPLKNLGTLVDAIDGEPALQMIHDIVSEALTDTKTDIREMSELAEAALKGKPLTIVNNDPERPFLKLTSRSHPKDALKEVPSPSAKEVERILLGTVENYTVQSLYAVGGFPETPFIPRPHNPNPNPPRANELRAITKGFATVSEDVSTLQKIGYKAIKGEPIPVRNINGQQVLALRPITK